MFFAILQSAIALCLAAQCALAQYQSAPAYGNGYQQRKLAPSPQTYGGQQQSYGEQQSYDSAPAYRAPSSAAVSQYDERSPAASYSKPAAPAYGRQASGYGAPAAAASYAKPAPKYEEPYVSSRTLGDSCCVESTKCDTLSTRPRWFTDYNVTLNKWIKY